MNGKISTFPIFQLDTQKQNWNDYNLDKIAMQLKSSKTSVKSADKKLCECNREIKEGMN